MKNAIQAQKEVSRQEVSREKLIKFLNEDLAREYQAIIGYVVYSQVIKGAAYMNIAAELEKHAQEELAYALTIAKQIDYLGGMPIVEPEPVKTSEDAREMLQFDLEMKLPQSRVIVSVFVNAKRWGSSPWPSTYGKFWLTNKNTRLTY